MLIGEVARRARVSARMLRHYDRIGLVSPSGRTVGGYREYTDPDLERLLHVESLRSLGLSLEESKRALDDPGFEPRALIAELVERTRARLELETQLLARLEDVRRADAGEWTDVLALTALVRGLDSREPADRQRSALATGSAANPPSEALARSLRDETDANVAGTLQWALRRSGDAIGVLRPALEDADAVVRRRAVETLARLDDDEATVLLADAIADPDPDVRRIATLAIARRGEVSAVPALLALVVAGDHDVDAAEAVGALATRHGIADEVVHRIGDELARTAAPAICSRLVQALAEVPSDAARRLAASLVDDPERGVAMAARYVVRILGDPG